MLDRRRQDSAVLAMQDECQAGVANNLSLFLPSWTEPQARVQWRASVSLVAQASGPRGCEVDRLFSGVDDPIVCSACVRSLRKHAYVPR